MTNAFTSARDDAERAAFELGDRLGRKFEPQDVAENGWLKRVATEYALACETTNNSFMADMGRAARSRWGLSNAQAKGVLNTMMARRARASAPASAPAAAELPNLREVPSARYRVSLTERESVAVRIDSAAWAQDKPEGTRCLAIREGHGWTNLGFITPQGSVELWKKGRPFLPRLAAPLATLANGVADGSWLIYALAYAQEGSECAFCGLELDTSESLSVGYGPTCAKKRGLPWGAKAEPMSVVMARLAAKAAGQPAPAPAAPAPAPAPRKRTYEEVFGPDEDGWGERKEFLDNTVNDAPAPSSLPDLANRLYSK